MVGYWESQRLPFPVQPELHPSFPSTSSPCLCPLGSSIKLGLVITEAEGLGRGRLWAATEGSGWEEKEKNLLPILSVLPVYQTVQDL